jgi:hypothetical protein
MAKKTTRCKNNECGRERGENEKFYRGFCKQCQQDLKCSNEQCENKLSTDGINGRCRDCHNKWRVSGAQDKKSGVVKKTEIWEELKICRIHYMDKNYFDKDKYDKLDDKEKKKYLTENKENLDVIGWRKRSHLCKLCNREWQSNNYKKAKACNVVDSNNEIKCAHCPNKFKIEYDDKGEQKYKKCSVCREKERNRDHKKRDGAKEFNQSREERGFGKCITCNREVPLDLFGITSRGTISEKCEDCFEKQQVIECNRPERDRDYSEYESREDVKERRRLWKQNHPALMKKYYMLCRKKQIENDINEYRRKNTEFQKKFRKLHPDLDKNYRLKYLSDPEHASIRYRTVAMYKGIGYSLDDEYVKMLVQTPCYYCGKMDEKYGINGIDRFFSDLDYCKENVCACCKTCNMMKNTMSPNVFIKKCEHIATFNGLCDGELNYKLFSDCSCSYSTYKCSATKREKEFSISKNQFEELTGNDCYICGKKNSNFHKNGIDRVDNNIGYIYDNCRACCGDCNFMKGCSSCDTFIDKCKQIYEKHKDTKIEISEEDMDYIKPVINSKKKLQSEEEKNVNKQVRMEEADKKLRNKHSVKNIEKEMNNIETKRYAYEDYIENEADRNQYFDFIDDEPNIKKKKKSIDDSEETPVKKKKYKADVKKKKSDDD